MPAAWPAAHRAFSLRQSDHDDDELHAGATSATERRSASIGNNTAQTRRPGLAHHLASSDSHAGSESDLVRGANRMKSLLLLLMLEMTAKSSFTRRSLTSANSRRAPAGARNLVSAACRARTDGVASTYGRPRPAAG